MTIFTLPPLLCLVAAAPGADADAAPPFVVRVVDAETGRGIPLVELKTVNEVRYVTDSAGLVAVSEPGLTGRPVFFHVKSHGYTFPADGFGFRGKALTLAPGGEATLRLNRVNVAERLYRVTGAGIYRDSVIAGRPVPISDPLLNAQVFGSDSVLMTRYKGALRWFWGDTNRPSYPLGNFHTPGAISRPPETGGLDPEVGVDLQYLIDKDGFARATAHLPGDGPTWLTGLAVVADDDGRDRLVAGYAKIKPPLEAYETGVAAFDDDGGRFEKLATFPLDVPVKPGGHTFRRKEGGVDFVDFADPFPLTRVRARLADWRDPKRYEAFTCLLPGGEVDRGPDGRARYAWRAGAPAVGPTEQAKLVRDGKLRKDEALLGLTDVETGKPVVAHRGSVNWNPHRGRWVLIAVEVGGSSSMLGEVWYAEADTPLGPWAYARKVVTHEKYSFYNPKHHAEFDKEGGKTVFFEGTYTISFSGNTDPTPRYEYNQLMYKLDLDDPRLNLPSAVYEGADGAVALGPDAEAARRGDPPAFFALSRPGPGTVPLGPFHALAADAKAPPKGVVRVYERALDGARTSYRTSPGRKPVGLVWPSPTSVRLPSTADPN